MTINEKITSLQAFWNRIWELNKEETNSMGLLQNLARGVRFTGHPVELRTDPDENPERTPGPDPEPEPSEPAPQYELFAVPVDKRTTPVSNGGHESTTSGQAVIRDRGEVPATVGANPDTDIKVNGTITPQPNPESRASSRATRNRRSNKQAKTVKPSGRTKVKSKRGR